MVRSLDAPSAFSRRHMSTRFRYRKDFVGYLGFGILHFAIDNDFSYF